MPTACVCVVQMSLLTHSLFVRRSAFTDSAFLPLNTTAISFFLSFPLSFCPSLAQPLLRHTVSQQQKLLALKINGRVTTDKTKYDSITETCQKSLEFGHSSRELQCEGVICLRLPDQQRPLVTVPASLSHCVYNRKDMLTCPVSNKFTPPPRSMSLKSCTLITFCL